MPFRFSKRSLAHLDEVVEPLRQVAIEALRVTEIDFAVTDGIRSRAEQGALLDAGATQTMHSRHLTGHAIDIAAYIGPRLLWAPQSLYDSIASAFAAASKELEIPIRWGGAWNCYNIGAGEVGPSTGRELRHGYNRARKAAGARVFNDSVHFEIPAHRSAPDRTSGNWTPYD